MTGTSGFIGSRLLQAARADYGNEVTAFSSGSGEGSHIVYQTSVPGFGLSPQEMDLIQEAEVLVHAGAFTPKVSADANRLDACTSNITFTDHLLALPWTRLKKIVFLSTIDVYGSVVGPITEDTPAIPTTLYGLSKLYGERIVHLFAAEKSIASQILRVGHVYGPGEEHYQKIIPRAMRNILSGENLERWGEGRERRSFIFINDVVSAVLAAVELEELPGVINVVGGRPIAMRDLLDTLVNLGETAVKIVERETHGTTQDVVVDNTKMREYLLAEETDLTAGLQMEFDHVKKFLENKL